MIASAPSPGEFDPKRQQGAASFTFMHNHTGTHLDTFGHIYRENSLFNNMPPPKPAGTVQGDAASVIQMVGRGVLLDVAALQGHRPAACRLLDHHRGPAEHREGAECRDPQGRHPAGPHGLAEDLGRAGQRRAARRRAHQVASAAARRRPRLPEVPERDGDRRHRLGQRGGGVGLPGETRLYTRKAFGFLGLPLHVDFIWNRGAYIIEILNLDELAKDQAYEFFFSLGPLLLKGGIGVPVNPHRHPVAELRRSRPGAGASP